MLLALVLIPAVGAVLAWPSSRWDERAPRTISLVALTAALVVTLVLWAQHFAEVPVTNNAFPVSLNWEWIPQLGIRFHLGMDGLSLILITLTLTLGLVAVAVSWDEIEQRVGFFHMNLMWVLTGLIGVFLALDLFLFYFFWELMLVPMYLLIALWGHERRTYAAVKFFIFTQASGLLMLVAIVALYFLHGDATGDYTFEFDRLLGTHLSSSTAMLLMLGFLAAFAVKLPVVPLHTWLPDAHTEAPTAGSVILAGLLLKSGAYGLLRFIVPLFPGAARDFTDAAMVLAVIGILYGALLSFSQLDFKRMVAYTSVSHMGFVLLGVFAGNTLALQGVIVQIIAHGLSTGALFVVAGMLSERMHTRELAKMGGLWDTAPRLSGYAMLFALGAMGLPGLGNFLAEFMILGGTFQGHEVYAIVASIGLISSTVYALWVVQIAFQGQNRLEWRLPDLNPREILTMGGLAAGLIWLGLYPQPVVDAARQALPNIEKIQASAPAPTGQPSAVLPGAAPDARVAER